MSLKLYCDILTHSILLLSEVKDKETNLIEYERFNICHIIQTSKQPVKEITQLNVYQ